MKHRPTLDTELRGPKEGEVRNPLGKGGWKKGQSGNVQGRPPGAANKVQLHSIWDAWKLSHGLSWLHYALNYKLPETLKPHEGEFSEAEHIHFRQLLFRNFWMAADFIRKTCAIKLSEEMGTHDLPLSVDQMLQESKARANHKLIDFERARDKAL